MDVQMPGPIDELLTVRAVSAATGHSRHSITRWVLEGLIVAVPIVDGGGRRQFLVPRSQVDVLRARARIRPEGAAT